MRNCRRSCRSPMASMHFSPLDAQHLTFVLYRAVDITAPDGLSTCNVMTQRPQKSFPVLECVGTLNLIYGADPPNMNESVLKHPSPVVVSRSWP